MDNLSGQDRKKLVEKELNRLKSEDYITSDTYFEVINAHDKLVHDELNQREERQVEMERATQPLDNDAQNEPPIKNAVKREPKTAQEIRDRNITWSLSIGVIFLLVGGTVLATSTWGMMSDWMKTGMIAIVAILFFGLAMLTKHVLNIEKTAFAFYVLGGLFLPIVYLSLGFYEQMGSYLSLNGAGRYLYGALGSIALFPTYIYLAYHLKARLFVWFANVTLTLFAGFFIGWFELPVDGFYLGIIIFNTLLVVAYHLVKHKQTWQFFIQEFALYIQGNLILSTLLMIAFYSNDVFHGFNLILTAAVYLAMLFVTNRKDYYFVFVVMLVYGVYQMIEFSALQSVDSVAYALLGLFFLALPLVIKGENSLHILFKYTSAAVSGLAFIFISVQALIIRMDEPPFILFFAYLLIAGNYIYLSNLTEVKDTFFYYLSSVFLFAALFELVRMGQTMFYYDTLGFPLFILSFIVFLTIGCVMNIPYLQVIKESSRDVSVIVMAICLFAELFYPHWLNAGMMLLMISTIAIMMKLYDKRKVIIESHAAESLQALSLGFAIMTFYMAILGDHLPGNSFGLLEPVSLVMAGLTVLLASSVWRKLNWKSFENISFYVSQGFYYAGMLGTLTLFKFDYNPTLRSVIVFGGILMAYLLYRKVKSAILPYVVALLSLVFYFTVLFGIHYEYTVTFDLFLTLQLPIGAFLLFGVGASLKRFDSRISQAYNWVAHLYYPIALLISLFYGEIAVWSTSLALVVYGVSVWYSKVEWTRKVFLYAGFTSLWLMVGYVMRSFDLEQNLHYSFFITSITLLIGWLLSNKVWRRRIVYYILPFSVIGAAVFSTLYPFELVDFIMTIVYAGIVIGLLHAMKWDILNGIPLLIIFSAVLSFIEEHPNVDYALMLLLAVIFLPVGYLFYRVMYEKQEDAMPVLDWYTIAGFLALSYLYVYAADVLWQELLPGILISVGIYLQRHRFKSIDGKWLVALAVVYLLQPYYTWLQMTTIPPLIEAESYVLPWVCLAIFVKRIAGEVHRVRMNGVQWIILIVSALILVQDALDGNTVQDAILLGSLSLLSLMSGMFFRQKSFFFVGAGVLLLNLFLQTRPFWGAMPWWAYLLIAGSILIIVASYNEWHKQKTSQGKDTLLTLFNKKVIQPIKKWE